MIEKDALVNGQRRGPKRINNVSALRRPPLYDSIWIQIKPLSLPTSIFSIPILFDSIRYSSGSTIMSSQSRPMGPRPRTGVNPNYLPLPTTQPLSIKKPKLKLSPINTAEVTGDEHSYYNVGLQPQQVQQPLSIATLSRPISIQDDNSRTLRPPMSKDEPGSFHVGHIRDVISEIENRSDSRMSKRSSGPADQTSSSSPVSIQQQNSSAENSASTVSTAPSTISTAPTSTSIDNNRGWDNERWSDDVLEVMSRLGEGAGGAVYKVKDVRTGDVYARKTIPTRTTPARQLLAELRHLSNTRHPNICEFYGAYMSSSSSEVNVVMELCEGGSLEAIMKKLQERRARVGEQLIGKIAEGVWNFTLLHSKFS